MHDDSRTRALPTPAQVQAARDALRQALGALRPRVAMELITESPQG